MHMKNGMGVCQNIREEAARKRKRLALVPTFSGRIRDERQEAIKWLPATTL